MTTLEEGLYAFLAADSGVSALVSSRIYPLVVPQDATMPAIAYQVISSPRDYAMEGASGLVMARVQITCAGVSKASATQVAEAVRGALSGHSGDMEGVTVRRAFLEDGGDTWSTSFDAPVYRQDYGIWYIDA